MLYLITGGSGYLGQAFIQSLDLSKNSVIILTRKKRIDLLHVTYIQDFSELSSGAVIDVVINLAGAPIDRRWTQSARKKLFDSRVVVTQSLLALIHRLETKPKVLLSASAIGYYGHSGDADTMLDENSEPQPSFTHDLCARWEEEALKAQLHGLRVCIMRLGVVLGKGSGFMKKMMLPFKMGVGLQFGSGKQGFSWIHEQDVVGIFHYLTEHASSSGAYNLVAPQSSTHGFFIESLAKVMKTTLVLRLPSLLVRLLFGEMGEALVLQGERIMPKRLNDDGYQFKFNKLSNALHRIVQECQ